MKIGKLKLSGSGKTKICFSTKNTQKVWDLYVDKKINFDKKLEQYNNFKRKITPRI